MKKYTFFLFLLTFSLLTMTACKDDDEADSGVLNHDGENITGPLLTAGTWQFAVQFPSSQTDDFNGFRMTKIDYFFGAQPAEATLYVYEGGSANQPGNILYQADITNNIQIQNWTSHRLATPITIDGQELWIGIECLLTADGQSLGCDDGPAENGGDWLYSDEDNEWQTYRYRTNESVNWNIRGILEK